MATRNFKRDPTPQKRSNLFKLRAEFRDAVYEHLLTVPTNKYGTVKLIHVSSTPKSLFYALRRNASATLMAAEIERLTVVVDGDDPHLIDNVDDWHDIQEIERQPLDLATVCTLLYGCPRLKELHFVLPQHEPGPTVAEVRYEYVLRRDEVVSGALSLPKSLEVVTMRMPKWSHMHPHMMAGLSERHFEEQKELEWGLGLRKLEKEIAEDILAVVRSPPPEPVCGCATNMPQLTFTTINPQTQSPLFRLPPEIRNEIYSLVFSDVRTDHGGRFELHPVTERFWRDNIPPTSVLSICRTCRLVNTEIYGMFSAMHDFSMHFFYLRDADIEGRLCDWERRFILKVAEVEKVTIGRMTADGVASCLRSLRFNKGLNSLRLEVICDRYWGSNPLTICKLREQLLQARSDIEAAASGLSRSLHTIGVPLPIPGIFRPPNELDEVCQKECKKIADELSGWIKEAHRKAHGTELVRDNEQTA
ncbi:uncharacterized protein LTR77_004111 [Saxophila tyrrhenica]|uniref:Uncharacterized protein n=1 Tax=Saxophila tyrrhenica TaxID=1690608 RepID=A0AAV9PF63_9PEZI|nr:hypothetical protein LTR77_004111 [Saxophila tyrrhenica]